MPDNAKIMSFENELKNLLKRYGASIEFMPHPSLDDHGLCNCGMEIIMDGESVLKIPYTLSVSANDLAKGRK